MSPEFFAARARPAQSSSATRLAVPGCDVRCRFLKTLLIVLALGAPALSAHEVDSPREYQVKAAFLFNFLKFVDWPPPAGSAPWVIGVAGDGDFAGILEETVRDKTVNGQPVIVKRLASLAEGRACNIVFVLGRVEAALPSLPGVLIIGNDVRLLDLGGIVAFYLEDNKVRFEIKPDAAKAAGLHISAQVLKLAKIR